MAAIKSMIRDISSSTETPSDLMVDRAREASMDMASTEEVEEEEEAEIMEERVVEERDSKAREESSESGNSSLRYP